jgi:hypothetical protein
MKKLIEFKQKRGYNAQTDVHHLAARPQPAR